jgi:hypothetical protein
MEATSNAGRCVADCPNADADIKAIRTELLKDSVTGGISLNQRRKKSLNRARSIAS